MWQFLLFPRSCEVPRGLNRLERPQSAPKNPILQDFSLILSENFGLSPLEGNFFCFPDLDSLRAFQGRYRSSSKFHIYRDRKDHDSRRRDRIPHFQLSHVELLVRCWTLIYGETKTTRIMVDGAVVRGLNPGDPVRHKLYQDQIDGKVQWGQAWELDESQDQPLFHEHNDLRLPQQRFDMRFLLPQLKRHLMSNPLWTALCLRRRLFSNRDEWRHLCYEGAKECSKKFVATLRGKFLTRGNVLRILLLDDFGAPL